MIKKIILVLFIVSFASCVSPADSRDSLADKKLQSSDSLELEEKEEADEIDKLQQETQRNLERRITEPVLDRISP